MHQSIRNIIDTNHILIKELKYENISVEEIDVSIFTEQDLQRFQGFISDKRKREFYFTRILLRSFNIDLEIQYRPTGKPIINNGHISISHSRNTIIIGYSKDHLIGVDIEYFNPKIHRIKYKFLAHTEIERFDIENELVLTLIWSIKEAVYKMEDIPGLMFKEHILVNTLSHRGDVQVLKNGIEHDYFFDYLVFKDFAITYCYLVS